MADLNKIIDDLSSLTVVEAAELSKQLEEKWGVTATTAVAAPATTSDAEQAEEKNEFRRRRSILDLVRDGRARVADVRLHGGGGRIGYAGRTAE